jgi:hypothetical protein
MEYIPFLHANRIFNIACEEDLTFTEVRGILNALLQENAFDSVVQESDGNYQIDFDGTLFEVWVVEMDVFIRRL